MSASFQPILALAVVLTLTGCSGPVSKSSLNFPLGDRNAPAVAHVQIDPGWATPEPKAYLAELADKVDDEWYLRVSTLRNSLPVPGTVVQATFTLTSEGRVQDLTASGDENALARQLCLEAVLARQPYGKWTGPMVAQLGAAQRLTLTFHYVWTLAELHDISRAHRMNRDLTALRAP